MDITSWSQLTVELEKQIPFCVQELSEQIKTSWKFYVQQLWYNARIQSDFYDRTMEVLNSISVSTIKQSGNTWTCEVFYDTSKINMGTASGGMFPAHSSIVNGSSFVEQIPEVIEFGNMNGGNPIVAMQGSGAMDETLNDYLSGNAYLKIFASVLQERTGCPCVIV